MQKQIRLYPNRYMFGNVLRYTYTYETYPGFFSIIRVLSIYIYRELSTWQLGLDKFSDPEYLKWNQTEKGFGSVLDPSKYINWISASTTFGYRFSSVNTRGPLSTRIYLNLSKYIHISPFSMRT